METAARFRGTPGNYVNGANIAGYLKVADSMMDQRLACSVTLLRERGGAE